MGKLISLAIEQAVESVIDSAAIPAVNFNGTRTEADMAFYKIAQDLERSMTYAGAMEALSTMLGEAAKSHTGLDRPTEEAVRISVEALHRVVLGKEMRNKRCRFPSREDFGTNMSRKDATVKAAEGFSELASTAKNAFLAVLEKIIAWMRNFWRYMTKSSDTFKEKVKEAEELKKEVEKHDSHVKPESQSQAPDGVKRMNSFRASRWSKVFPNPKNPLALKVKYSDEFYPTEMLKSVHKTESIYAQILKVINAEVRLATTRIMTTRPSEDLLFEADPLERTPKLTQHFLEVLKTVDPEAKIAGDQIVFTLPCGLMQYTLTLNSNDAKCVGSADSFRDLIKEVNEAKARDKIHRVPETNLYSAFGASICDDMENLSKDTKKFIEALEKTASTDTDNRAKEWEYRHYVNYWMLYGRICYQLFAVIGDNASEISSAITSFWTLSLAKDDNTAQSRD